MEESAFQQALRRDAAHTSDKIIRKLVETRVATFQNAKLLLNRNPPAIDIEHAVRLLFDARDLINLQDWNTLPNRAAMKRIGKIRTNLEKSVELIEILSTLVKDAIKTFSRENLSALETWCTDYDCPLLYEEDTSVEVVSSGFDVTVAGIRTPFRAPPDLFTLALPDTRRASSLIRSLATQAM